MIFSLNEVEATAKKATRGAGYDWGVAEDAAKSTRWLCASGLDGIKALAMVLEAADRGEIRWTPPGDLCRDWQAGTGSFCPLLAGTMLSDFAGIGSSKNFGILDIVAPLMFVPFAAMAARQTDQIVAVDWEGVSIVTDGHDVSVDGAVKALQIGAASHVDIQFNGQVSQSMVRQTRAEPDGNDWEILNTFADHTYAPATEESRNKGAGASRIDTGGYPI